jgi:hypothetical protein
VVVIIVLMILMAATCWPAFIWHGYTATGGFRWDVHSTIACCIWWGFLFILLFIT